MTDMTVQASGGGAFFTRERIIKWAPLLVLIFLVLLFPVFEWLEDFRQGSDHIYLVQAQKSWSERFLEEPPEAVGRHLLANFAELAGRQQGHELLFTHRWRYAFADVPLGSPFLWDRKLQLGVCGDWCLGRRVEDAWRSGADLAEYILEHNSEERQ